MQATQATQARVRVRIGVSFRVSFRVSVRVRVSVTVSAAVKMFTDTSVNRELRSACVACIV